MFDTWIHIYIYDLIYICTYIYLYLYVYIYLYVNKEWFIQACQVLRLSSGQTCERFSSEIHFAYRWVSLG